MKRPQSQGRQIGDRWNLARRQLGATHGPGLRRDSRLRSWRRESGADRQVALGGTPLQDAQRCERGRPRGAGTPERGTREASKVVRVGDTIEVTIGSIRRTLAVTGVAE